MAKKYAIIDIETTGGVAKRDRITEIAIVISDGKKILDQYDTLINPGISIPYHITRITGITDDMVADAPRFHEVAKKIVEMTEDTIFVAHNVSFDYGFIQNAFASLGYSFSKRRLCTVKMSRKTFPGLKSYALGSLIKHFNIQVNNRHRALDDTLATTIIFHKIIETSPENATDKFVRIAIDYSKLPEGIDKALIHNLPTLCGVYYMSDADKQLVYIGKSINIQKRIKQHFSKVNSKSGKMMQRVRKIHYELTGSELIALLKEAKEIKENKPEINIALKNTDYPYCVYVKENPDGYLSILSGKISKKIEKDYQIIKQISSLHHAKSSVNAITSNFGLCKKINKLEKGYGSGPCFDHTLEKCAGACIGLEDHISYNERIIEALSLDEEVVKSNFFIIDAGRSPGEKSVVLVEEGNYKGFGFISDEDSFLGVEELKEAIDYVAFDKQYNQIINTYLSSNSVLKILEF